MTSVSELPVVICADWIKDVFTCLVFIKGKFLSCFFFKKDKSNKQIFIKYLFEAFQYDILSLLLVIWGTISNEFGGVGDTVEVCGEVASIKCSSIISRSQNRSILPHLHRSMIMPGARFAAFF
ncbi:hypothetical protein PUN28_019916 [Cardiocondyla obscurior]|uniref:Uncharacterized protein n=1 Tax=Cardiocondyla obscurior TaxID=286306 RepID=A0AAW2EDG5_9HYME